MYSLIALGFVLVYKATDAINFAQGEFVMIAGFVTAAPSWCGGAVVARHRAGAGELVAFGFILERVMLRKLIGRPVIAVVMATIGWRRSCAPRTVTIFSGSRPLRSHPRRAVHAGPLFILRSSCSVPGEPGVPGASAVLPEVAQGIAMRGGRHQQVAMAMGIDVERYFGVAWR